MFIFEIQIHAKVLVKLHQMRRKQPLSLKNKIACSKTGCQKTKKKQFATTIRILLATTVNEKKSIASNRKAIRALFAIFVPAFFHYYFISDLLASRSQEKGKKRPILWGAKTNCKHYGINFHLHVNGIFNNNLPKNLAVYAFMSGGAK